MLSAREHEALSPEYSPPLDSEAVITEDITGGV
jgi:hypothetical protein